MENESDIREFFTNSWKYLDERGRRMIAAAYAVKLGYGGVSTVSRLSGLSRGTITKGVSEITSGDPPLAPGRVHKPGAGRPSLESLDQTLLEDLFGLVEENTYGDPETPRLWTLKSTRNLAQELQNMGHAISYPKIGQLLKENGYSLQSNFKAEEGADHIDRDAQFKFINSLV
ncbi:MAG: ISAzo13 family transposase, partial [Deltaproteobacteria bacterium]|nr:ISAzo13 family transposase [Deltaproteobacteria bacterium]